MTSGGTKMCKVELSIEHLTKALLHRCSNERADEVTNTHTPDLRFDD